MKDLISLARSSYHTLNDLWTYGLSNFQQADLSIFHQFVPPPIGGAHQFLRAFWHEAEHCGFSVENNSISKTTHSCLFNSFNFDERRLKRLYRNSVVYVHRVDGPIDVYRGRNEGVDQYICQLNQRFADKTIFQSNYSLEKHLELGLNFKDPSIILNSVDPTIFHKRGRITFSRERKIRLIATSWSENIKKGASVYRWLDEHLDWEKIEFTFVGRAPIQFKNITLIHPVSSDKLGDYLRQNDIYITASQDDPCSNSLLEALHCGLPAIYLKSGGHPEIVRQGGLGFDSAEEIPAILEKMIADHESYQSKIDLPSIEQVTKQYLKILELI